MISRQMRFLRHIDFDCRVTDTKDFVCNIRYLREVFQNAQFSRIYLSLTGFPMDIQRFKEQEKVMTELSL
uniref:Uncharacterized protein n=1 Tax=Panagrolaimus superbus TaxID=310955 RepID=A0A914Z2Q7_9BILA